jgi:AcrR family transcriptional regulator
MPKIWTETIAAHRDAVRDATIKATAALLAEHGMTGVTMSRIAQHTGIGRATLYKYFPDVESILRAWHERLVDEHLQRLVRIRDHTAGPAERLRAVLTAYAEAISHRPVHDDETAEALHQSEHVAVAHERLRGFVRELIDDAASVGAARRDVPADELTLYALHGLAAASSLPDRAAVGRLVRTVLHGLGSDDDSALSAR